MAKAWGVCQYKLHNGFKCCKKTDGPNQKYCNAHKHEIEFERTQNNAK